MTTYKIVATHDGESQDILNNLTLAEANGLVEILSGNIGWTYEAVQE